MAQEEFKVYNKYRHIEEGEIIKKILHYCYKSNYVISFSNYDKLEDIIKDANRIRYFGNEPSVRRAIKLLNKDNKIKDKIDIIMSDKCRARLDRIKQIKDDNKVKFKVTREPIVIVFE
tara:strand:- start:1766 stop:2119 length:354 start_codon:yes stop_codon:yes gene_type:complete